MFLLNWHFFLDSFHGKKPLSKSNFRSTIHVLSAKSNLILGFIPIPRFNNHKQNQKAHDIHRAIKLCEQFTLQYCT